MNTTLENEPFLIEQYRISVKSMLANESEGIITNSMPLHATIILEEMIRSTKQSFMAITEKLSGDVWTDSVIQCLIDKIRAGVKVRIITARCNPSDVPVVNKFREVEKSEFVFESRELDEKNKDFTYNFAVSDSKAFRFEHDRENRKAIFCANDVDLAKKLVDVFEKLFGLGQVCR
jgi:hypothetical protein